MRLKTFELLRNRDFALLLGGAMVSRMGDAAQGMAQAWLVMQLTHSAFKVGIVALIILGPKLLLSTLSGAIADRYDRYRIVLIAQLVQLAEAVTFLALVATGRIAYWHICALMVVYGVAESASMTARQSLLPSLVPKEALSRVFATMTAASGFMIAVGPSIGGVILGVGGVQGCLLLNIATFVVYIGTLLLMRQRSETRARNAKPMSEQVREGIAYVRTRQLLWLPILISLLVGLIVQPYVRLMPFFATDVLKVGKVGYGLLCGAPAVGATIGSLVIASMTGERSLVRTMRIALVGFLCSLVAFATVRNFQLALGLLACNGCFMVFFKNSVVTLVQKLTREEFRGRVMSLLIMDEGMLGVGALLLGAISDQVGPSHAILSTAGLCAVLTLPALLFVLRSEVRADETAA